MQDTQAHTPFSSCIIGDGTLPIQCAEILLDAGQGLYGIISADVAVREWAEARGILHVAPNTDLAAFIGRLPIDYLFSVVNSAILPPEILALPRKGAINYHDAPLPGYAGSHATSWALMQRESTHGVTWHLMSNRIDAGDILKQHVVDIAPGETALTLNAKCYEAAIRSFAELIHDLAGGRVSAVPQDLSRRTYFPLYKRPPDGAVLSWDRCAHDIATLVRALHFGPYPNPLSLPKLILGGGAAIVSAVDVLDSSSIAPPGTILGIAQDTLRVATASRDVGLRGLLTVDGRPLSILAAAATFGLREGDRLANIDPAVAERLTSYHASSCRHETYWVRRLTTVRPVALPYAHAGRCRAQGEGGMGQRRLIPMPIPDEVRDSLVLVADHDRGAKTVGDVLLAAFGAYLARMGGVGSFDIGYLDAASRRDLAGLEPFFVSHVPLRIDVDDGDDIGAVCRALREQVDAVRQHKTYARDMVARYPQFHAIPELELWHGLTLPVGVERVETLDSYAAASGPDLTLVIAEGDAAYAWAYNPDALDEDGVARLQRQFAIFLHGLAAAPSRPIRELPLLLASERRRMLVEWNMTTAPYRRDICIHQLFEEQAARTPNAVAVIDADQHLTYASLNARANQLALHLQALGVGPEIRVAVCLNRSVDMVVGLLGILKAGGAYVPLEPASPPLRMRDILSSLEIACLVTQESLLPSLGILREVPSLEHLICLDAAERAKDAGGGGDEGPQEGWERQRIWTRSMLDGLSTEGVASPVGAENTAYIIFTSGSTGIPKGVMLRHRPVINVINWVNTTFRVRAEDRVLFVTSPCFDLSVYDIFGLLAAGGSIRVASADELREPCRLLRIMREEPITFWDSAPAALQQLAPFFPSVPSRDGGSRLRLVFLSGDWIPVPFPDTIRRSFPGAAVIALGGATEAAIWSNYYPIGDVDPHWVSIPYGRPIHNARYYILNPCLSPCPSGAPGDLYIGGECLASGYANDSALTAERFIPDPFGVEPGARLYRTGDLARYRPDGAIEFLGRGDHQVKIRGFRVELGEVEATLAQHSAVREAVVTAREDTPGDKRLMAYVVPQAGQVPTAGELRAFVRARLPEHMTPAAVVSLGALPLTPNGKVDRAALPAPARAGVRPQERGDCFVAPHTPVAEMLADIWSSVLRVERVGDGDNFFDLGGHSLNAAQVVARVRDAFAVDLPLRSMFEHPTLGGLADHIDHMGIAPCAGQDTRSLPLRPVARAEGEARPLSYAQEQLWFLDQLEPGQATYNIPRALRLTGPLDTGALGPALGALVVRHEILRTTFAAAVGGPVQVVGPARPVALPVVDLRLLSAGACAAEARRLAEEEARRPFDLGAEAPLRAGLLRLGEEEHVLLLTMHHIAFDGWSLGVLAHELGAFYDAARRAGPVGLAETAGLAPLPIQYADYAAWQRGRLGGVTLAGELAYWRGRLEGAPPVLALPTDRPRPTVQSGAGTTAGLTLPTELTAGLRALGRRAGATLFMTLLAAFQVVLLRYTGQEDLVVGTPIAGRTRTETEGLIGFFANTLPLRTSLAGDPSFEGLLGRVREVCLGAYAHQELPFAKLVEALRPVRDLRYTPLVQVLFELQEPAPTPALEGLEVRPLEAAGRSAKFDLTLTVEEVSAPAAAVASGLTCVAEYNADLFEAATIECLLGHFRAVLEAAVAAPARPIRELPDCQRYVADMGAVELDELFA